MPRIPRGPIDLLVGYTFLDPGPLQDPPLPPDPPEDDYYITADGNYTIWGVGLITFGPPTEAQQDWIADPANYSDLSTFPTDWVSFGFPMAPDVISLLAGRDVGQEPSAAHRTGRLGRRLLEHRRAHGDRHLLL